MLLTYSPLPKLRHFMSMFEKPLCDHKLSSPWCEFNDNYRWYSCSAHSLFALALLKSRSISAEQIIIWVPDFFCNSSLEPVKKLNVNIVFYPINKNFEPDYDWCYKNHVFHKLDIFLLVHYFGIPVKSAEAKKFCENRNAWLVEDAAHCFLPVKGIGESGDFVLYSPHKHIAIMDGALLVIKKSGQEKLDNLGLTFERNGSPYPNKARIFFIAIWILKRFTQVLGLRRKNKNCLFWPEVEMNKASFNHTQMSKISKIFLTHQLNDLNKFAKKRKFHYKLWKNQLLTKSFKNLDQIQNDIVPYFAPFELNNETEIEDLYKRLIHAGVPVSTWPDLPKEVISNPAKHSNALHFRMSRIYIQVHQSLNSKKIIELCKRLL